MTAYNRDKSIQLINSIPPTREQELADQLAAAIAEIERQSTLLGLPALELATYRAKPAPTAVSLRLLMANSTMTAQQQSART